MLRLNWCTMFYFNPRPREEGDTAYHHIGNFCCNFNPRPREEGDALGRIVGLGGHIFQSTPS